MNVLGKVSGKGPIAHRSRRGALAFAALLSLSLVPDATGQGKRSRQDGLNKLVSSSTAGEDNLHLTAFGRTFLWDNQAAQKIPPLLPHLELNYGVTDYLDVGAGLNVVSYVLQPGAAYLRAKITTPDNKNIRFLGFAQTLEARRSLLDFFPSNGYRVKNEGFGPEGFIFGNDASVTSMKLLASMDAEMIRFSSWLPFKFYANLGYEWAFGSWIREDNKVQARNSGRRIPEQDFSKLPMGVGLEFKTYMSDFFAELEAEPFARQVSRLLSGDGTWTRVHAVNKTFDIHFAEAPIYISAGAKLKYRSGLDLQGGISWLVSRDLGPGLGPCVHANRCREGASDGFSPFYPQWKVFGLIRYPLWFTQPSSELYRSFLLKRYEDKRKKVDLEATMEAPEEEKELSDAEKRRRRLEQRRREADGKAVDLN